MGKLLDQLVQEQFDHTVIDVTEGVALDALVANHGCTMPHSAFNQTDIDHMIGYLNRMQYMAWERQRDLDAIKQAQQQKDSMLEDMADYYAQSASGVPMF